MQGRYQSAVAVSNNVPSEENSAKIDKLTGQIRQLEESMTSLRQMYMDGVIHETLTTVQEIT